MDKVRLGRALGYGTRHAAKTLAAVAEAAASPDPQRPAQRAAVRTVAPEAAPEAAPQAAPRPQAARMPSAQHVKRASRSFWGPLATFSSALTLRVAGVFYGVIALAMANGAWRLRGVVTHAGGGPAEALRHLWLFVGFAVLFGYFAVSSFVRANLRERQAARG